VLQYMYMLSDLCLLCLFGFDILLLRLPQLH